MLSLRVGEGANSNRKIVQMRSSKLMMMTACLGLVIAGCSDDSSTGSAEGSDSATGTETSDSNTDSDSDSQTGEETDSDSATTDMSGDGDGDDTTGDGDGDTTGDGDGDTGDGDGDATTGDGDGDDTTTGDGDGDPVECAVNEDCEIGNCVDAACVSVPSCFALEELAPDLPSGVYELDPDGEGGDAPFPNYCDLDTNGGGWTLVIKALGNSDVFTYDSGEWTDQAPYQANEFDLDRNEAKLPSWSTVDYQAVMVAIEAPVGDGELQLQYLVLETGGNSLWETISNGGYVPTNAGRQEWLGLVEGSALQANCNLEGLNVTGDNLQDWHRVRIGIIGNEQDDCGSPDSRLGIGGFGTACGTSNAPNGNFTGCNNGNDVDIAALGVVFVR